MGDQNRESREGKSPIAQWAKYSELAFLLPAAVFLGYLLGAGADRYLGTRYGFLVGVLFGIVAGFVQLYRIAMAQDSDEKER